MKMQEVIQKGEVTQLTLTLKETIRLNDQVRVFSDGGGEGHRRGGIILLHSIKGIETLFVILKLG